MTDDEIQREGLRGLFATAMLVVFVSALFDGHGFIPPNFRGDVDILGLKISNVLISFKNVVGWYTLFWGIYAFLMSLAYSNVAGRSIIMKLSPRVLRFLVRIRLVDCLKVAANIFFFVGWGVILGFSVLMALWWRWSFGV